MNAAVNEISPNAYENSAFSRAVLNTPSAPSVRRASGWQDLVSTVEIDDIELVLWSRPQSMPVIDQDHSPASDFEIIIGAHQDIFDELATTLNNADWPTTLRETVAQDVQGFLSAMEAKRADLDYRLRLQAVSDDACRKFHQDRTFQRLIITYRGDGTVWRRADDPTIHTATEMECVLLRGKRVGRDPQILHRSPIFTPGLPPRLIMVIDVINGI